MKRFATLLCLLTLAAAPVFAGQPTAANGVATAPAAHAAHLAKALNLTEDQKAAAQPLQDELAATVKPLFADLKVKHQALRAALEANADAATVGEAAIAAHAVQAQIKAAHEKFATAFAALLTPEQATKFSSLKAAGHGKMAHFSHAQ